MEQKPPRILQAKTSFRTINEFLSSASFIQKLLKNLWVLLELGPLPWRQMNFTFLLKQVLLLNKGSGTFSRPKMYFLYAVVNVYLKYKMSDHVFQMSSSFS